MIYVITGGPGFGKSTLIELLSEKGFWVGKEAAREIIGQQKLLGGDALPWKNIQRFEALVAASRVDLFKNTPLDRVAFADRGLHDQIAYSWYKGKNESALLAELTTQYRYAPEVFVTAPWKEIYRQDPIRQESFEEACEIHRYILETYQHFGYRIIELPFVNPEKRVEFIIQHIEKQNSIKR